MDGASFRILFGIIFIATVALFATTALAQATALTQTPTRTLATAPSNSIDEGNSLPKYELGLGYTGIFVNDYPGSNQLHYVWLPVPYFVYRGDFLRADRDGSMHGVFIDNAEVDIDASASGSVPVNDSQDEARAGMPNIDWMGELGPRVLVHILRTSDYDLDASIPVRWVFSTDLTRVDDRGFDFNPEIYLRRRAWFDRRGSLLAYYGALWGTSQLNRYFYEVTPQYATPDRPVYSAVPGYMYDYVGLSYRHDPSPTSPIVYFLGFSEAYMAGAANRDSPLMKSIENQEVFVGFIYDFYRSRARVSRRSGLEE